MLHIALHVIVPLLVAFAFFRPHWRRSALLLLAGILVDADHLLADPIYDPERCSMGFHPLHTTPAIGAYLAVGLVAVVLLTRRAGGDAGRSRGRTLGLLSLGLLLHMALDWGDCVL